VTSEENTRKYVSFLKASERGDGNSFISMMTDDATGCVAGSTSVSDLRVHQHLKRNITRLLSPNSRRPCLDPFQRGLN
jgi:hypothetical protein